MEESTRPVLWTHRAEDVDTGESMWSYEVLRLQVFFLASYRGMPHVEILTRSDARSAVLAFPWSSGRRSASSLDRMAEQLPVASHPPAASPNPMLNTPLTGHVPPCCEPKLPTRTPLVEKA
ncbi:uncharacterized protein TrAtP1_000159 [Trichoderma atroviride]|uniref:uncharacterized protein n=1 Tax=Hypocrea atroviridis TaxID=63577 RepID=UPI003332A2FB|nr:hypothetical protein TrAtP1_000159 [Trichoderma atroviride]